MRLRHALVVGVTAATVLAGASAAASAVPGAHRPTTTGSGFPGPGTAHGSPVSAPSAGGAAPAGTVTGTATRTAAPEEAGCGSAAGRDFPIDTRIHGGPSVHYPGGGFEHWSVDLTNTTDRTCGEIHPVIVFAGRDRGLTVARIMLEYYDEGVARWRPAELESTSEDEVVAILGTRSGPAAGGTPAAGTRPGRQGGPQRDDRSDGQARDRTGGSGFTVEGRSTVSVRVRLALTADTPPNQVTVNAAVVQRHGDDGDWVGESRDYRFAVLKDYGAGATVTHDELATTGPGSLLRLGAALGMVLAGGAGLVVLSRRLRAARG
ncbi:hypothetical protein ACIBCM_17660 [Streptomyces sp. NPDC051018]|uniref:hypothetical protein n=1 Tax=Streptomyces sp. NPDC051018 TaxID=3365639 RepID=UPI00378B4417